MNLVARSCTRLFHCHNQQPEHQNHPHSGPGSFPSGTTQTRSPPASPHRALWFAQVPARTTLAGISLVSHLSLLREDCAGIFQCATAGRTEGGAVQVAAARDRVVVRPPRGRAVGRAVALRVLRVLHASHRQREELRVAHCHPNADVLSTQFASVNIQSLSVRTSK